MKKIIALLLFALAGTSFKTEATHEEKIDRLVETVMCGGLAVLTGASVLAKPPYPFFKGFMLFTLPKALIESKDFRRDFFINTSICIISYYMAKKSYQRYKQLDENPAAE